MTAAVRAAAVGAALVFLGLPPATAGAQQRGHGHHRFHHRPVGSRLIVVAPFVPFGFYSAPPVVYSSPVVYYAPPPVYYPPPPSYYGPPPAYAAPPPAPVRAPGAAGRAADPARGRLPDRPLRPAGRRREHALSMGVDPEPADGAATRARHAIRRDREAASDLRMDRRQRRDDLDRSRVESAARASRQRAARALIPSRPGGAQ